MHIAPQTGKAFFLKQGQKLRVTDPLGQQVADLFCFNAQDSRESLSAAKSMDYADGLYLTSGNRLYSNRDREMLLIESDTCGRHDLIMSPCSLAMFKLVAGNDAYHPSCHENLARSLAAFSITPDQILTTFNIFMNVEVSSEGRIRIQPPRSKPGDSICFHAQMDLIVGLTACSHEETNNGFCKPVQFAIH